jgi:hypothetical protein
VADVFISYAHVDDGHVRGIVRALEELNLTVWWDIALRSGDRYGDVIEKELAQAKCVLAVWSRHSRNSDWVRAEASLGNDANKLVQIVLHKDVKPPLPFNIVHFEPIVGRPNQSDENWRQLVDAVRRRVGGEAAARAPARAPTPINAASVLSTLSAMGLLGYLAAANAPAEVLAQLPIENAAPWLLYAAAAFGAGAFLVTTRKIAAVTSAGR